MAPSGINLKRQLSPSLPSLQRTSHHFSALCSRLPQLAPRYLSRKRLCMQDDSKGGV